MPPKNVSSFHSIIQVQWCQEEGCVQFNLLGVQPGELNNPLQTAVWMWWDVLHQHLLMKSSECFTMRVTSSSSRSLMNWAFPLSLCIGYGRCRPSLLKRWGKDKLSVKQKHLRERRHQKDVKRKKAINSGLHLSPRDWNIKENVQNTVLLFWCPEIKELFFYIQDHVWDFRPWQFDFNLSVTGKCAD